MADFPAQLPTESAQAYEAACAYFSMGAARSQDAVSQKLAKSRQLLGRWSALHRWADRAREYDAALAKDASAAHTARYLADLEDHRKRSAEAGKALYTVAGKLLQRLNVSAAQMEVTPSTLSAVRSALQTALDLEAHALGIDKLMPELSDDSE